MGRLIALTALASGVIVFASACGGSEEEQRQQPTPTATAVEEEATPTEQERTPEEEEGLKAAALEAFPDVPLPQGAEEAPTGAFTGLDVLRIASDFGLTGELSVEAYSEATFKAYDVDASPEDILQFYKDHRGDWQDISVTTSTLVWIRDDGARAVYISASVTSEPRSRPVCCTRLEIVHARTGD